jgi:hypothetical protein
MHPWRGFGIFLGVAFGTPVLLLFLVLSLGGGMAMVMAYVVGPQLVYIYPFAYGMKNAPAAGLLINVILLTGLAMVFGQLTRSRTIAVQLLLGFASLGALWILGRALVPLFGLDVSLDVRM